MTGSALPFPVPLRSWLADEVEIGQSSIHGLGMYAAADILAGATVARLGGTTITDEELGALEPPYSSVVLGAGAHLLIDPDDPVRYGNHSCDPNLWPSGLLEIEARRDIFAGEELTIDYATQTGVDEWTMDCRCATPSCRETVTGRDWMRTDLRARYGTHWAPTLLDRMRG